MRSLALLALLPLAACATYNPFARSGPADTPEQAACRSVARDSDAVRDLRRTVSIGDNDRIVQEQIDVAQERAFRTCLRERRLPGGGGVELTPRR
ncbi:MAG: hypothetical protein H7345_00255 [Rubritepida sp.]|nr:hypothetical protein [Rubritepida sp.]